MPSTLHKTRKHIAKKRGGVVNALHEKSRDSMRLHKAAVRDQRIEKIASARGRKEQTLLDRVAFFQQTLAARGKDAAEPDQEEIQRLINSFVRQYDEEYDEAKKTRRPGRPASVKEDLLKVKISGLETEYKAGFLLPDFSTREGLNQLLLWEGSWSYLPQLKWVKVNSSGQTRSAAFPAGGI